MSLKHTLTEWAGVQVDKLTSVGGGCDSTAYACHLSDDLVLFVDDLANVSFQSCKATTPLTFRRLFVKTSKTTDAEKKFQAEREGLKRIHATNTIRVPLPLHVCNYSDGALIVLEFIDFVSPSSDVSALFGQQLAEMHLALPAADVKGFGFPVDNTCGESPQINTWCSNWIDFFAEHRLRAQRNMITKRYGDQKLAALVDKLIDILPKLFPKNLDIKPSLLHGDLWSGNWAFVRDKNDNATTPTTPTSKNLNCAPIIFDTACYYGHHEAELSIMTLFGKPHESFFKSYFARLPRASLFQERQKLYQLYHLLNHYTIFGSGYRGQCVDILKGLLGQFE
eukprot:m.20397 g.20397  ORF g.20397 m.20397 type:complete len:337 (+) comp12471_c0_seq1:77-1087(+)